ncbi:PDZ domain-containing protein [Pontibacillus yanchengensis]|uniref:PDZ domain-containing protein n=1 Tax=Pontibacillus yanchengensis TaxID=462910 RepID=A0A6I5A0Z8_9BACI|nr:S41 family peptidase [Pontibacillus yanchengensis]MYL33953.1 PDZ domain-containing protein [Pontibacillus yanchengensis]
MKHRNKALALLAPLSLALSIVIPTAQAADEETIKEIIKEKYVDELDEDTLKQDVSTILDGLDPYSTYFTKEEFQSFNDSLNQNMVGIGVSLSKEKDSIILQKVFPETPASEAELSAGDVLISVDGTLVADKSVSETIELLKGVTSSTFDVTVKPPEGQQKTVSVTRRNIQLPSITSERLGGNIGYLQLHTFAEDTGKELQQAATKYEDVEHWIIDMQNNPGGYVSTAREVVGAFPNVPTALVAEYRDSTITYAAQKQDKQLTEPISLLINENSASASEIVAGALQDYDAATLYGETTYGKGLLQELMVLPDESALKLTTARFFTPQHNPIQNKGITPDIQTEEPLTKAHLDALNEQYSYKTFEEDTVSASKTFEINVSMATSKEAILDSIHLFELGHKEVDFTLTSSDKDTFLLNPTKNLQTGKDYMLMIHPGWKSNDGIASEKGIMQPVDVEA